MYVYSTGEKAYIGNKNDTKPLGQSGDILVEIDKDLDVRKVYKYDGSSWILKNTVDNHGSIDDDVQGTSELDGVYTQLGEKANQIDVDSIQTQITNIGNASPKGVYTTLPLLQAAYPTGTTGIYLVTGNVAEVASLAISVAPTSIGNVTVTLNGVATNIAVTSGVAEVASLTVTAPCSSSGDVTVTLNGVGTNVALDSGTDTTTDAVATKIRNTAFSGWTTGGTGSVVTFTATAVGVKTDASYSAGTTGATGTMTTTTQGVDADTTSTVATKIRGTSFSGWTTGGSGTTITFTCNTTGAKTDSTYSAGSTGATGTMTTTTQGVDADYGWYYWNSSTWTRGGTYQATKVGDESVGIESLNDDAKSLVSIAGEIVQKVFTAEDFTMFHQNYNSLTNAPTVSIVNNTLSLSQNIDNYHIGFYADMTGYDEYSFIYNHPTGDTTLNYKFCFWKFKSGSGFRSLIGIRFRTSTQIDIYYNQYDSNGNIVSTVTIEEAKTVPSYTLSDGATINISKSDNIINIYVNSVLILSFDISSYQNESLFIIGCWYNSYLVSYSGSELMRSIDAEKIQSNIPTKVSELENDNGYVLSAENSSYNLFDNDNYTNAYYDGSGIKNVNASYICSDKIVCGGNNVLSVSGVDDTLTEAGAGLHCSCFDINDNYLGLETNVQGSVEPYYAFITQPNTAYVYIWCRLANVPDSSKIMITLGAGATIENYSDKNINVVPDNKTYLYRKLDSKDLKTWYKGKIISRLGDSLTQNPQTNVFVDRVLGSLSTWHGIGGTRMSGNYTNAFWTDDRINSLPLDADVIMIAGGTNDRVSYTLGTLSRDNFDITTLCGSINVILSKLYYKYQKVPGYYAGINYSGITQRTIAKAINIIFLCPPYQASDTVDSVGSITNDIISILRLWGIKYVDLVHNYGINAMNAIGYYSHYENGTWIDPTHRQYVATEREAREIVKVLREIEPIADISLTEATPQA